MTIFTGNRAKATWPAAGFGHASAMIPVFGHIAVAANPADGDIYKLCKTPDKYLLCGGILTGSDIDTGTEVLDIDIGWDANGAGVVDYVAPWGDTYANAGSVADPDGLGNLGVWTGDATTDIKPVPGIFYPLVLPKPLFFNKSTMIQLEANVAANAFTAGNVSFFGWGVIIG
jgi:hypothetical protein